MESIINKDEFENQICSIYIFNPLNLEKYSEFIKNISLFDIENIFNNSQTFFNLLILSIWLDKIDSFNYIINLNKIKYDDYLILTRFCIEKYKDKFIHIIFTKIKFKNIDLKIFLEDANEFNNFTIINILKILFI